MGFETTRHNVGGNEENLWLFQELISNHFPCLASNSSHRHHTICSPWRYFTQDKSTTCTRADNLRKMVYHILGIVEGDLARGTELNLSRYTHLIFCATSGTGVLIHSQGCIALCVAAMHQPSSMRSKSFYFYFGTTARCDVEHAYCSSSSSSSKP